MHEINLQDRKDIQGLIVYGYAKLRAAYFVIFKIEDVRSFKNWLMNTSFHSAEKSPEKNCLNIAFTSKGFKMLSDDENKISKDAGFDQAFLEGMDTDYRNRILGDYDHNDPMKWNWGNRQDNDTHGILMIYASNEDVLEEVFHKESQKFAGVLSAKHKYKSIRLNDDKEHFGFTDGISQPVLHGLARNSKENNFINPGEVILGFLNAYNKYPLSPKLNGFDVGKNGSYMVIRDMQQDVKGFWKTMLSCGNDPIKAASKIVGRWPNGIPLEFATTEADAIKLKKEKEKLTARELTAFLNNFEFYQNDKDGLKCPIGAHIRRGNPKDSKNEVPSNPNEVSNKHRILRRGKSYGAPLAESMEIKDIIAALDKPDGGERGLNFICFNSDIKRQFEFIQQTWMNNMKFAGLYDEVDPLIGVQGKLDRVSNTMKMLPTKFTEPSCPYRNKYNNIPPFVKVRAGGYFFFPSLNAIKFLAK